VVSCGEFRVRSLGLFGLSAEIFGNWKTTEAKTDWGNYGETMVKRGENVVANAILPGELRPIIARFEGNCEFASRIVEGVDRVNSGESIELDGEKRRIRQPMLFHVAVHQDITLRF
jgi:hypothetical protein